MSDALHEWALAEAVISCVMEAIGESGASAVKRVELSVGELQDLDEDAMRLALGELSRGTPLEKTSWEFRRTGAKFRCRACGAEWRMEDVRKRIGVEEAEAVHFVPEVVHAFVRCASCGSPDFEVVEGRGILVEKVEAKK